MKTVESTRRVELRHSHLLDQLILHDDARVRFEAVSFVYVVRPPADAPFLLDALNRLVIGFTSLAEKEASLKALVDQELLGLRLMVAAVSEIPDYTQRHERPNEKWLSKFPAYDALLRIVIDDVESLRGLTAEYLRCKLLEKRINVQFANAVRRGSHSPALELARSRNVAKSWSETHKRTLRWLADHVYGTEDLGRDFQKAVCRSFTWRSKIPGINLRRGLVHDRSLTEAGFKQAAESLRLDLVDAVPLSTAIAAAFLSGLNWDLAQNIPLCQPDDSDWILWLDVNAGCFNCDLNPLVRGAAKSPGNENYQPATRAFSRYLPKSLADALRRRKKICPDALSLGELCQSYGVPPEHVIGEMKRGVLKPSIARFFNSRSHLSKMLEISAPMAALTLGEFGRVAHSRLFYHSSTENQIADAISRLENLLEWGPIRAIDLADTTVGSQVVPLAKSIQAIAVSDQLGL